MNNLFTKIFRKKYIHHKHPAHLKKCLSAIDLTLLGIGCIIGTGIFVLTGIAAANQSGPAVTLSFIISGFACTFAALSYAELSSSIGGCGSAYGYSYVAFGEFFAWIMGWILLMEYGMSIAAVANGWSGYFNNALVLMDISLPETLSKAPSLGGIVNLPAMLIILIIMSLLIIGAKQSAIFNAVMVFIKLLTITLFISVAIFNVNPANWYPFMPYGWFSTLPDGKTVGVLAGASIVFFAYVGFDAVSTAAEEAINPQRDLPRGIIGSLAFCTVIYIIVSLLLTGVVPYQELNVSSPVAYALQKIGFQWASAVVSIGVISGLTTVILVLYYALTRIIFAMSRDGLLPHTLSQVNKTTNTPVRVIIFCGLIISLIAGFIPLGTLAEIVNIGTLAAFVIVSLGVIFIRKNHKNNKKTFKNKWHPLIPLLGIFSCSALMCFLPGQTWIRFLIWVLIGIIFYFVYSIRHSHLNKEPA